MGLRDEIVGTPETLSDLTAAADLRFRDGETLLNAGRYAGSVYLLGLSAEMWLKLAVFRYRGIGPSVTVDSQLVPAKVWMKANCPAIGPEAYHSLSFWAEYLIRFREADGHPLSVQVRGLTRHHVVGRLYRDWKIDLRYRNLPVTERLATRVFQDAAWVRQASRSVLWRR